MRVVYHTTPRRRFMAHSTSSHLHTHEKLLHEAQALTGIKNRSIHDVMVVFAVAADEAGALTRADFERALRLLMGRRGDEAEEGRVSQVVGMLWGMFVGRVGNTGEPTDTIDYADLSAGLAVLTAGTVEQRLDVVFTLYVQRRAQRLCVGCPAYVGWEPHSHMPPAPLMCLSLSGSVLLVWLTWWRAGTMRTATATSAGTRWRRTSPPRSVSSSPRTQRCVGGGGWVGGHRAC